MLLEDGETMSVLLMILISSTLTQYLAHSRYSIVFVIEGRKEGRKECIQESAL